MAAHDTMRKPKRATTKVEGAESFEDRNERLRAEHRAEMATLVKDVAPHNHGDELDVESDAYKNKHKG